MNISGGRRGADPFLFFFFTVLASRESNDARYTAKSGISVETGEMESLGNEERARNAYNLLFALSIAI